MAKLYTHSQFMSGECTHRQYYAGLCHYLGLTYDVFSEAMIENILNSQDEHLNDIPLKERDYLGSLYKRSTAPKLRQIGESTAPGFMVCTFKELARQYIDSVKAEHRAEQEHDIESPRLPDEYNN